ncbi:hypothetical protein AB1Y20_020036 [Prymnesium parvum]|uniref:Nucleotide-diphospho-sugar transferase domain-containing protein n=1 Tax=Prymnesium parvum TaxID=97485 RepID=A0AB34JTJ5_PRYPA
MSSATTTTLRAFSAGLVLGVLIGSARLLSPERLAPHRIVEGSGRRPAALQPVAEGATPPRSTERATPPVAESATPPRSTERAAAREESRGGGGKKSVMHSVGWLRPLGRPVDVAEAAMADRLVARRSFQQEIILFESDAQMKGWAYHWVHQMRRMGYEHWTILTDGNATCQALHAGWRPMVDAHGEEDLSCVWSSFPRTHAGWAQWAPKAGPDVLHNVYQLWCTRWWVALQLLRRGVSVLSLDVDAVLLSDLYALLHAPPLAAQDVVITRNSDNSQSLNCGFVYFNRRAAASAALDEECGAAPPPSADAVPAAEWIAELMWERIRLFLDVERSSLAASPKREVLWEQDVWNDLAKSIELRRRVFPWAVGYGHTSDLWPRLGYQREVKGGVVHQEKWVEWRRLPNEMPPWQPPAEPYAEAFYAANLRRPLLWIPACAPANASARVDVTPPPNTSAGIPLGLVSTRPLRAGRLAIAPSWLASLGDDPESDWAASDPPAFAYLHLTNMWHCFPHMCWSKAGRLFWLRAHGFWDRRLDALGITPRGRPYDARTRALRLPAQLHAALERLTPRLTGGQPRASVRRRALAFRRMHALLHNLVLVAALLGRKPVIPSVPCSLIEAVQPTVGVPVERSRFGVSHPSVVATGAAAQPRCHVSAGTWRPGGPDQCYHSSVMHSFDFDRFVQLPAVRRHAVGKLRVGGGVVASDGPPLGNESRWADEGWRALKDLCRQGTAQAELPVLELEGLLPVQDLLLDRPLSASEFKTEGRRKASGRPRWTSLLQQQQLLRLKAVCPGAAALVGFRKACVGYFLAE